MRLYLKSSTIFVPSDTTNLQISLLKAVSAQEDFGLGCWAKGYRGSDGSNYYIGFAPIKCWQGTHDYLLQIQ